MNALDKILDEKKCVLELVQWQDASKGPMYAYVLIKKARLPAFKKLLAEQDVDLSQYGLVMAHGRGSAAPHGLEEELVKAITKAA